MMKNFNKADRKKNKGGISKKVKRIIGEVGMVTVPMILAFAVYCTISERLYEIRGYHGIGGEIFLTFLIWYAIYRFMDSLF